MWTPSVLKAFNYFLESKHSALVNLVVLAVMSNTITLCVYMYMCVRTCVYMYISLIGRIRANYVHCTCKFKFYFKSSLLHVHVHVLTCKSLAEGKVNYFQIMSDHIIIAKSNYKCITCNTYSTHNSADKKLKYQHYMYVTLHGLV